MKVIATIAGKEAIPVRALPFMSPPLSPACVASGLANPFGGLEQFLEDAERPLLFGMHAYYLEDGRPVEIAEHTWVKYRRAIEAKQNPFDPEYRDTLALLPAGVFVWRWEFEMRFGGKIPVPPGAPESKLIRVISYEPLIPQDMRATVMEGFEQCMVAPVASAQSEPPPEVIDGKASEAGLLEQRTDRLRQWLESKMIPPNQWKNFGALGCTKIAIYEALKQYREFRADSGHGEPIAYSTFDRHFWKEQALALVGKDGNRIVTTHGDNRRW